MNTAVTVLNDKREENYQSAVVLAKKGKIVAVSLIPVDVGLFFYAYSSDYSFSEVHPFLGLCCLAISLVTLVAMGISPEPNKESYFPQFSVGDQVFHNPLESSTRRKYEINQQHPILNSQIPVWEVVSVGETSLVIKDKSDSRMLEIEYSNQETLFLVDGLLPSTEERKMLAKQ